MSDLTAPTYFLLDSQQGHTAAAGWRVEHLTKLQITPTGLQLALQPSPPVPLKDAQGTFGGLTNPTGVALDSQGTLYIADRSQHQIFRLTRRDGFQGWATAFRINQGPFASDRFVYVPTAHRLERWRPSRQVAPQRFADVEVISETVWNETQAQQLVLQYIQTHDADLGASVCNPVIIDRDLCQESIADSSQIAYPSHLPAGEICKSSIDYLPCLGGLGQQPRQLNQPNGLAVSKRDWLYVADTQNHRIQVFALPSLTLIEVWGTGTPGAALGTFHEPWDVAVDSHENVYIADKANHRLQKFDAHRRQFSAIDGSQLRSQVFQVLYGAQQGDRFVYIPTRRRLEQWDAGLGQDPVSLSEVTILNTAVATLEAARQLVLAHLNAKGSTDILVEWDTVYPLETDPGFDSPTHLAIDANDWVYVIDQAKTEVKVLDSAGRVVNHLTYVSELRGHLPPTAIIVDADGKLVLANSEGLHRYDLKMGGRYEGCCGTWEGQCTSLAAAPKGDLVAVGGDLNGVAQIPVSQQFEGEGFYFSRMLDSEIDRCPWHKIHLHFEPFPLATQLQVWTYTANTELSALDIQTLQPDDWLTGQMNGEDFLVLSPPGRFLWLKMRFAGNGIASPVLQDLEVHFPRQSYLQYLPAVYQSDPISKDFLDRFLSIFQTVLGGVEEKIDHLAAYFDPDGAPNRPFLEWLAGWLDMTFYQNWPLATCRRLLRHAPELYRQRGTAAGLKQLLWLALGVRVEILEHFRLRQWLLLNSQSTLGGRSVLWGNALLNDAFLGDTPPLGTFPLLGESTSIEEGVAGYAHRFSVFVPAAQLRSPTVERQIRSLIDAEKPAHTQYILHKVEPHFRVGVQSTVGLNLMVGTYPQPVLNHCSTLGVDTVLNSTPETRNIPAIQVGRDRVGINTALR
ncbi:MAG: type VI secretion system baseplate subunit TssG [Scytolyngbya sp. HA4215-MV1]|jgi:phage tail-like protein|nr:type VI secretion system baseplate subunit TssG [Scytolyngbya sp. HA4215-MV1]